MRKIKWYESRETEGGAVYWWTQRDKNGNCYEIRRMSVLNQFRLFVNEIKRSDHNSLADAQRAARDSWVE